MGSIEPIVIPDAGSQPAEYDAAVGPRVPGR